MTDSMPAHKPTLDAVLGHALQIPAAPDLLPRLMEALDDPERGGDEIGRLISLDPGIASSTLRLANSSWFGARRKCDDLHEAIFRLGAREVFRIATTSLTMRWMDGGGGAEYGWEPGDFCRHSLSVGIASRLIARELSGVDEMKAYTAGLLHDIGKLALVHAAPEYIAEVRSHQEATQCSWRAAEHAVLGFDHLDAGAALMEKWDFPESLVMVARYYPVPGNAPETYHPLLAAVHAGKHLAVSLGIGVGEEGFLAEMDSTFLKKAGFEETLGERILPDLSAELVRLLGGALYVGRVNLGKLGEA